METNGQARGADATALIAGWRRHALLAAIPDAVTALVFLIFAVTPLLPPRLVPALLSRVMNSGFDDELGITVIVEAALLMIMASVTDVATRLERRPPLWAVILIAAALFVFSGYGIPTVKYLWANGGLVVLVPFILSACERFAILWYMPGKPRVMKVAARALMSNRIAAGMGALALMAGLLVVSMMVDGIDDMAGSALVFAAGFYFAIGAVDTWRVRQPFFEARPRVLLRFDALGIDYLAPV
jgi:hypothetical protein